MKRQFSTVELRGLFHGAWRQRGAEQRHKTQRVEDVVQAVVEAGAFDDCDRDVDDKHDEEHAQAYPCCCRARFIIDKQQSTREQVDHGGEIGPDGMPPNPCGSERGFCDI